MRHETTKGKKQDLILHALWYCHYAATLKNLPSVRFCAQFEGKFMGCHRRAVDPGRRRAGAQQQGVWQRSAGGPALPGREQQRRGRLAWRGSEPAWQQQRRGCRPRAGGGRWAPEACRWGAAVQPLCCWW